MTNPTIDYEVTSYDDPIFKEVDAFIDATTDFVLSMLPDNPVISKDDEWNNPEYDKDYENHLAKKRRGK